VKTYVHDQQQNRYRHTGGGFAFQKNIYLYAQFNLTIIYIFYHEQSLYSFVSSRFNCRGFCPNPMYSGPNFG